MPSDNYPFKVGDINEFYFHGQRTKETIESVDLRPNGHLVVISTALPVTKDFIFPTDETLPIVEEKKKTWIEKIKGWFN